MKIAMVVLGGLHPSGRDEVVPSLLALFTELATRHEVHAFALRHLQESQSYSLNGFQVHDLGRPSAPLGLTRLAQARALRRAMTQHGPFELVHGYWGDPAGSLAASMGRHCHIPSIATCDSGEFESMPHIRYGSQLTVRGRRAIHNALSATRLHVCTEFMAAKAREYGATAVVIPLTSVPANTRPQEPRPTARTTLRLVQVASVSRVKNQRLLIDALAILEPSIDVHLDLVGQDTLDGDVQRHAASLGLGNRVTFHGFVPHDRLSAILEHADFYVQSSLHEAAAVSVLEAAAHGLPIIGTRVGYVADWFPERALAIGSPDAATLAAAIRALHGDRPEAAAMAARARTWVLERNVAWVARQFDDLYRDALKAG